MLSITPQGLFLFYQLFGKNQFLGYDKKMIIPKEVKSVISKLEKSKFQAYIVGGCVRDLLRKSEPNDWDIATNAKPDNIKKLFPKSYSDNKFGTVTVLTGSKNPKLKEIEITTFRIDERYSDGRHPDSIKYAKTIEQDLARRDFTVNAIALAGKEVIDPFNGGKDLKNKAIKTVGRPQDRFSEDALRMIRAVRFICALGEGWNIEEKTKSAIKKHVKLFKVISQERIREELMKIIMSDKAFEGIELLRELGLLKYIIPELEEGYKIGQNKHHIYDIYDHNLRCLKYAVKKDYNKHVRLAALLHDVGKPKTKRGNGPNSTFYGHEIVGAKMTRQILERLKFSKKDIEKVVRLVRYHLFYYNVGEVSESSVRRLVRQVGMENIEELLQVRYCDRIGSGCPKAVPYKLRHLKYLIEKISHDPISVKKLKVNGNDIMKTLKLDRGPKIGQTLDILLGQVLSYPKMNEKKTLMKEVKKLGELDGREIEVMARKAREEREKIETKKDQMTKEKYWVS